jgi:hypothetical protein
MIEKTYLSNRSHMESLPSEYRNMASSLYTYEANEMTVVHLQNFMIYAHNNDSAIKTREELIERICWYEDIDIVAAVLKIYDLFCRKYNL